MATAGGETAGTVDPVSRVPPDQVDAEGAEEVVEEEAEASETERAAGVKVGTVGRAPPAEPRQVATEVEAAEEEVVVVESAMETAEAATAATVDRGSAGAPDRVAKAAEEEAAEEEAEA